MTKPPKWWSANGPPSPTTPMSQLDMQVQHDRQTSKQIRNNGYYELDNEDDSFMFKHKLSDGTFVFTTHSSVKKLRQVLKTTKQISLSKDVNNSCANQNILNNSPQKNSIYSNDDDADFTLITRTSPNLKPLQYPSQKATPGKNTSSFMHLTKLESNCTRT